MMNMGRKEKGNGDTQRKTVGGTQTDRPRRGRVVLRKVPRQTALPAARWSLGHRHIKSGRTGQSIAVSFLTALHGAFAAAPSPPIQSGT